MKKNSGSLRRIKALVSKEFHQIVRDPSSILISVILPAILLFLYGLGVSLDAKNLRVGLVLEDSSPVVQSFAKTLTNSRFFEISIARDRREFEKGLVDGSLKGMVVIPSYFSSFLHRTSTIAPIQIVTDGSEPNTARFVQNYVEAAYLNWVKIREVAGEEELPPPHIDIKPRYWYNEDLDSTDFLVPGSLAIIMTLIGTLLTALVVAREWERGTMESLISTPVKMTELILGKLISYFLLGMGSFILSTFFSILFFQVPFRGSWIVLLATSAIFLVTSLGLGLLISTLSKNQFAAAQAALVSAFLPAFILSGFVFEISSMPLPIRIITYIIPARYYVTILQTLFLVGEVKGLLLINSCIMLLIGVFFFLVTSFKTKKRLE